MQKKQWIQAVGLALALASAPVMSAEPGWFGGIRVSTPGVDAPAAAQAEDLDVNWRVFQVPIRLKLGMEVGLVDRDPISETGPGLRLPGVDKLGWQVVGVGNMPISKNWGVFGKLGAHRWGTDVTSNFSSIGNSEPRPTYGLGLKYHFTDNLSVSGEWDRYQLGPGNGVRPDGEIDLLSIGLKYRF